MVFGISAKPTTLQTEDPKGTKKYPFSFGTMTRGELQTRIEGFLIDYQHAPLDGAEEVLAMFATTPDAKILRESPTIQSVVLGAGQPGPITHFLQKAVEQQEALGNTDVQTLSRFQSVKSRYEKVLVDIENGKVLLEDPKGTKIYPFSFGDVTSSQLQQKIETILSQYDKAGLYQEGAQALMDMVSTVPDRKILNESAVVKNRMLGGINGTGPIDYFLDKAEAQLAASGDEHKAPGIRLSQLQERYMRIRSEALALERPPVEAATKFELRVFNPDGEPSPGSRRY